jgi:UDP-N-acetylglucosamine transferase subunit ALG13
VIFVTVGTHQQPFQRLLDGLSALESEELVVQYGHGTPPPNAARAVDFMSFGEMLECFRQARAVVTHAGVGSVLSALRVGHTPIVVPRLHRHGEHVDDHQVEFVRAISAAGRVLPAFDVGELPALVASAPPRRSEEEPVERPIHAAVRACLRPS